MESYDIIANQPVVIDNVRPGSRGRAGAPPAGRMRRRREEPASLSWCSALCPLPGPARPPGPVARAVGPAPAGAAEPMPEPCLSQPMMSISAEQE